MSDTITTNEHIREHDRRLSGPALRAKALESLLVEKGRRPGSAATTDRHLRDESGAAKAHGSSARAWIDPAYKKRLLEDATAAIAESLHRAPGRGLGWRSRTPQGAATSSCARCAPATLAGSGCRPSGTSQRRTARAPSSIRAACSRAGRGRSEESKSRVGSTPSCVPRAAERRRDGRWSEDQARGDRHARRDDRRGAGQDAGARQAMNGVHDMAECTAWDGRDERTSPLPLEVEARVHRSISPVATTASEHRRGAPSRERIPPPNTWRRRTTRNGCAAWRCCSWENGLVTARELETRRAESKAGERARCGPPSGGVPARVRRLARLEQRRRAQVQARRRRPHAQRHPIGHTRLPRYARGHRGVIDRTTASYLPIPMR